ncbi:DNA polymerase III subunit epsilon [Azospirillaceae bacterium]
MSTAKIVAIDFETANQSRNSACSVGLAWIEDGKISRTEGYLIRPPDNRFSPFNIGIHGITPSMVAKSPTFGRLWATLYTKLADHILIAHNASFDKSVMNNSLAAYQITIPAFTWLCTVNIGRRTWPSLDDHKLPTLARALNIPLKHHDHVSDAAACAEIALAAMRKRKVADILQL